MIPQYILMGQFHMTDRLVTLILMQAFSAFGIFLMRQFFMGLPNELREAEKSTEQGNSGFSGDHAAPPHPVLPL